MTTQTDPQAPAKAPTRPLTAKQLRQKERILGGTIVKLTQSLRQRKEELADVKALLKQYKEGEKKAAANGSR